MVGRCSNIRIKIMSVKSMLRIYFADVTLHSIAFDCGKVGQSRWEDFQRSIVLHFPWVEPWWLIMLGVKVEETTVIPLIIFTYPYRWILQFWRRWRIVRTVPIPVCIRVCPFARVAGFWGFWGGSVLAFLLSYFNMLHHFSWCSPPRIRRVATADPKWS